jgi:imidazolonepropionase-like amidohydrolase
MTLVRAGRLLDVMTVDLLPDQVVVIEGERVVEVLPAAQLPAERWATEQVIDLSGCTVLPGLIDLHTHLVGPVEAGDPASVLQRSGAVEALAGVANARATLAAGFTSVRDLGSFRAFVDIALRDAIEAGVVPGPRMQCAGAYITCTDGGGSITGLAPDVELPAELRVGLADTVDQVRSAARRILAAGADLIKVISTGAVLAPGTTQGAPELTEEQIRAAVEVAADRGAFVAAHAHGAEGAKRAARAGVRSVEHGSLLDDEALDLIGEHGVWLVADVYNGDWIDQVGNRDGWPAGTLRKNRETTDAQREVFAEAVRRGLNLGFGTDAGVFPHGMNARQFPVMVGLGMSATAAIRAATVSAAECIGRADAIGSLQPGRWADLVAMDGHELGDLSGLRAPAAVLKGGRRIPA